VRAKTDNREQRKRPENKERCTAPPPAYALGQRAAQALHYAFLTGTPLNNRFGDNLYEKMSDNLKRASAAFH
jgi:hypothetical protein